MQGLTIKKIVALFACMTCFAVFADNAPNGTQRTPEQAFTQLKEGNQRFTTNTMKQRNFLVEAHKTSFGQTPFAVILNCMDSRSIPELFFDQSMGDLFVIRVAGNVMNEDILGSMEYATKVVGTPLIVVLGHTSCGAVKGACSSVNLGNLDNILDKIRSVIPASQKETGTTDCKKPELINAITKNNVMHAAKQIIDRSPIIKELVAQKKVAIVMGEHDIKTGVVTFY